ncbi:MAG: arginine--tRNA ligase, partial [Oscillospiraceae bacterium]|nr:arginine--tRNA ligase [Oscillospiraceae bacterium]
MNYIEKARVQLTELIKAAYAAAAERGELPAGIELSGSVELPRDAANGDWAANFAMANAKAFRMP